ncbi:adenosine deaminase [Terriglobus roseus DSM 18391]|uniref:adenosine deaminase n=1 Tax=Terriglobus roseus (strain DSM 18391 / NRRL B-41598 / KBS 63) TaxID=926566 RepID=I3ZLK0_TERRK|nr:adenosine deaminase [Terriglobus roseus]AFL90118.1 adenosine deaminase [Terriglobus roseus DSM 18391]
MLFWKSVFCGALLGAAIAGSAGASAQTAAGSNEARTAARVEALRNNPAALRALLVSMPKGGDLHMHLSGAVYAETFLQNAAADNLCVDPVKGVLLPNQGLTKSLPPKPVCVEGSQPAASAFTNQTLYDHLVDSFSMRAFVPSAGVSGHDQFFATFPRFGGIAKSHQGEWVDEVATRAAAQNEQYLELMTSPDFNGAIRLAIQQHWDGNPAKMREALLAGGLRDNIAVDRAELDAMDATRNAREHCGTPEAKPACKVQVRYLYQILRSGPPERVFAQTLLGYEVASVDPRVVGINFVQPEDTYLSMSQYDNHMIMLQYLHTIYPKVHLSLHAGELGPGMVPPEGLRFHIHDAVEKAGAERIGHGVDIMYEDGADALLKDMAAKHVMVEINLTSNDVILGVTGTRHPLHSYLAAGVPFALSTDDEGVSRIDLTNEYVRAVVDQGLTYAQLKSSARASLEHAFLAGNSLWQAPDKFTTMRRECSTSKGNAPAGACEDFLKTSDKARQQWELEKRFRDFEAGTKKETR